MLELTSSGTYIGYDRIAERDETPEERADNLGSLLRGILQCLTMLTRLSLEQLHCRNVFPSEDVGCLTNLR